MEPELHKISAKNTRIDLDEQEDAISVTYLNTEIFRASKKYGNANVRTGGWCNNAMLTRINQCLAAFHINYRSCLQINSKDNQPEIAIYDLTDKRTVVTEPLLEGCSVSLFYRFTLP